MGKIGREIVEVNIRTLHYDIRHAYIRYQTNTIIGEILVGTPLRSSSEISNSSHPVSHSEGTYTILRTQAERCSQTVRHYSNCHKQIYKTHQRRGVRS